MQIQKVQSNQPNFGTEVYFQYGTKALLDKSPAKRKFVKQINALKNNGMNDVFVLKHCGNGELEDISLYGVVFEKKGNKILRTPFGIFDMLLTKFHNYSLKNDKYTDRHANLLKIYDEAKNKYEMRQITENENNKYLSGLEKV